MTITLDAFAKVNRHLCILGKRDDGAHELDTIFQTIDLTDRLTLSEAETLTLSVDDPRLTSGEDNLVLRAARRDPHIAAGPIVLALADLATLLFYFNLAGTLFG